VVGREELWPRAHDIATQIAARNPRAVQGTIRAIWESLEMPPAVAKQNGMSYTHIGNVAADRLDPRGNRREGGPIVR
jgi:enoyl-CoA hydratase/carnithine racemase